ncbi:MAG: class I SAM-dependent methyltransferase [Alphaproteobacteria bacterium]|nr:class I SAM-dependent methyltransferase [Alphaproteobacteria bacterium]
MTHRDIAALLADFPRTRPPLTEAHQRVYAEEYKKTRGDNKPLTSKLSSGVSGWMHRKVAASHKPGAVLELGAGTLNHLPFESENASYDIVEPFTYLHEGNTRHARIRNVYKDIAEIPDSARYGRIISVAVLEHLSELPYAIARSGLLLEEGGVFQAGIPSEGGLAWGLAWRCSTGLAYRLRTGLDYKTLMRHEHINRADEILAVARHFFGAVRLEYFPLPGLHASLFIYLECTRPDLARCREYVAQYNPRQEAA